ncbi:MAG: dihydrofolate reductase family protein, partial [Methanopyri archaeon]|nr:dihydrofolate reductase family protein [Methanopyri archaeon]
MGRKIILYIAASLDGFIARKDGFVDWLSPYENTEEDYGYKEFYDSVGTVVMGNTTYKGFGEYYRDKPCFVFSRVRKGNDGNATFVNGDMEESMKKINSTGTKNIWLVGGGEVIDAFLRHDLIDELIISIIPT